MKTVVINTVGDLRKITHGLLLADVAIIANLTQGNEVVITADAESEEIRLITNKMNEVEQNGENS